MSKEKEAELLLKRILELLGQDSKREELQETPKRFFKTMLELTSGEKRSLDEVKENALFPSSNKEMIIFKKLAFYSLCEHHLLPFFGELSLAYFPNGKVIGLGKISEIVEIFTKRLQIQERLSDELALALEEVTEAKGVAVFMKARHMCLEMRDKSKANFEIITSSYRGLFSEKKELKNDFLSQI